MSDKILIPHIVTIENRDSMTITGVIKVMVYDEFHIIMQTDYGQIIVTGRNLVAGEISSSQNMLKLKGTIESLQYKNKKDKSQGVLSKLFK